MRLLTAAMVGTLLVVPAAAFAVGHIAGSFQGWNPNDPAYELTMNANGVYVLTKSLGAGTHQYKAIDGSAWGQDFPGANQSFALASTENVTWYVNFGAVVGTRQGDEYVFHSKNPPIVCGNFMSELGGVDWDQTNTTLTVMSDPDLDDVWEWQSVIPAGAYQFKIVLNNNWNQDTFPPSQNYSFGSDGVTPVLFRYRMANNVTEVFTEAAPMVEYARVPDDCPQDPGRIQVKFSKDVEETTAETTTNYWISGGQTVLTATRDNTDNSLVTLEVSPDLVEGNDFWIVVTGVTDLEGQPIDPNNNDACFYLFEVVFELNMHLYVQTHGIPSTVHIQGDTYPLTWGLCEGCQAYDDGAGGGDVLAGDSTYTTTQYFSMGYDCVYQRETAQAESTLVRYKYVVDCTTWEGSYEFNHYVWLDPNSAGTTMNVWWEDVAPGDTTTCLVGVRFQLGNAQACTLRQVRGSVPPLDWSTGVELTDDGAGGDLTAGDGIYSALVLFPIGSYRYLQYKHVCDGVFECEGYPNRQLTLDDVNGCMPTRYGPMEIESVWNWCEPVAGVEEGNTSETSWGKIKALYRGSE